MNSPLFEHLFTTEEKETITSLLIGIAKKNRLGQPLKLKYFKDLEVLLAIPVLEKLVSNQDAFVLDASMVSSISVWIEDKKILLKGLIIDLLAYNDVLIKEECEAAQQFYTAVGIEDVEFNRILQSKHFNQ